MARQIRLVSRYQTAEYREARDREILAWGEQDITRFWSKYSAPDLNGCETWAGKPDKGYGVFWAGGQKFQAHRAAVILRLGAADYAYQPDSLHDVGPSRSGLCVGPMCGVHVRLGGHAENGQAPDNAKLDWAKVADIRARYAAGGVTQQELADDYGVDQAEISIIVNYKSWRADVREPIGTASLSVVSA